MLLRLGEEYNIILRAVIERERERERVKKEERRLDEKHEE
jgi:hypothetical protein